jgi:hypothetical protein
MINFARSLASWVFVVALLGTECSVFGQWIDIKSLPEDVLNCDECRRRLGLPPLNDPNRPPSSHGVSSTTLPSSNTTFNEIILSSRVLSGSTTTNQPASQSSQPLPNVPHGSNKLVLPSILPKIDFPKELPPPTTPLVEKNETIEATVVGGETPEQAIVAKDLTAPGVISESNAKPTPPAHLANPQIAEVKPELKANLDLPLATISEVVPPKTESDSVTATIRVEPSEPVVSNENLELKMEDAFPVVSSAEKESLSPETDKPKLEKAPEPALSVQPQDSAADKSVQSDEAENDKSILMNRLPPALTGEFVESEPATAIVEKAPSLDVKTNKGEDEDIAVAVPTNVVPEIPMAQTSSAPTFDPKSESDARKNSLPPPQTALADQASITSSISRESLIVDGILTSPTAQKIQIDLLKSQLTERDALLNEFSRMQKMLEDRMDVIVRSNDQLAQKDSVRVKELDRLQRESEKAVQERELQIANLQAELAGARADAKNQLTMLAKQVMEAQQSKTSEIIKLSDQLLAARKVRTEDIDTAKTQLTAEQQNELAEAEKVVEEQRKAIQDLQSALKRLGSQLSRLDQIAEASNENDPDDQATDPQASAKMNVSNNTGKKPTKLGSDFKKPEASETANKTKSSLRIESRAQLPTPPNSSRKSENDPKRRSF